MYFSKYKPWRFRYERVEYHQWQREETADEADHPPPAEEVANHGHENVRKGLGERADEDHGVAVLLGADLRN